MRFDILKSITPSRIRNDSGVFDFQLRLVLFIVAISLSVDILNQTFFFVSWREALRSWAITIVLAGVLALVVGRLVGKAHLELYRSKQEIERLSRLDPLTGLQNRRALFEATDRPVETMVLVIIDIDRFKRVNDTLGHLAGDDVICSVANIMAEELAPFGQVGRLGGEEFALVSVERDPAHLLDRLTALKHRIGSIPMILNGVPFSITISAGMAQRTPNQSFMELYADADKALYAAKAAGRNRICLAPSLSHLEAPDDQSVQAAV